MKYVFKVDLDIKMKKNILETIYIPTRKIILEALGFKVNHVKYVETRRGYHFYYYCEYKDEINDYWINFVQLLLGDDTTRVKINMKRIDRGVKNWNKLFSRIIYIKKRKYIKCPYCNNRFMIKDNKAIPID